ncbi:MAG: ABC transporter substrate-binding protein [Methanomassiliicoccales archaeon]
MEGEGAKPLPSEDKPKGAMNKTLVIVIAVILVLAVVLAAVLLMGGGNKGPTASFSVSSNFVSLGTPVVFNGSASSDSDGSIAKYIWWFGDSVTPQETTTAIVSHTYLFPGKYIAILEVEDDKGARADTWSRLVKIEVTNPPAPEEPSSTSVPFAMVATSADSITSGTKVDFNAGDSKAWGETEEGPVLSSDFISGLIWNFNDGSSPIEGSFEEKAQVNHTFTGAAKSLFPTYCIVKGEGAVQQRYYNTIVIPPTTTTGVKNPDTFVMVSIGEPESLDPAYNYESAGGEVLQNVYETLVWYDGASPNDLKPVLATNVPTIANGGVSPDGKNYTYYIKQGVKFHDGSIMTPRDVEFSLERVLMMNDPWSPAWMLGQVMIPNYYDYDVPPQDLIEQSVTVSGNAVTIHLVTPYPAFNQVMAYTVASVMSEAWINAHGGVVRGEAFNEYANTHTMGTGPYKLKEWVTGQYWLLERHEEYHLGPAPLKYVLYKKVEDVGTREMMLFSGDADCIYVPRQQTGDVRGRPDLRIVEGNPTFNLDFVGFNQNIRKSTTLDQGDVPAWFFADQNVRNAFVRCFDYDKFINDVLLGTAIQPNGVIPLGMFGHSNAPKYQFNLQEAANYLKLAIDNRTGVSYAEQGFRIVLYYNSGNTVREAACQLLKNGLESLKTLGYVNGTITVSVQALDWSGAYLPAVRGRTLPIFFLGWAPDYNDPDDYTQPFYRESGTYALRISLKDPVLTQMVDAAAVELNVTKRAQMYNEMEWYVYNKTYYMWTAQATQFHVERAWVTGYYFNPMFSGLYYYVLNKQA